MNNKAVHPDGNGPIPNLDALIAEFGALGLLEHAVDHARDEQMPRPNDQIEAIGSNSEARWKSALESVEWSEQVLVRFHEYLDHLRAHSDTIGR